MIWFIAPTLLGMVLLAAIVGTFIGGGKGLRWLRRTANITPFAVWMFLLTLLVIAEMSFAGAAIIDGLGWHEYGWID